MKLRLIWKEEEEKEFKQEEEESAAMTVGGCTERGRGGKGSKRG